MALDEIRPPLEPTRVDYNLQSRPPSFFHLDFMLIQLCGRSKAQSGVVSDF